MTSLSTLCYIEKEGQYLYISTMYEVQESKLNRRLQSGRLKEMSVDNVKKIQYIVNITEYSNTEHDYFEVGNGSRHTP